MILLATLIEYSEEDLKKFDRLNIFQKRQYFNSLKISKGVFRNKYIKKIKATIKRG